jgi:hypothetical protein
LTRYERDFLDRAFSFRLTIPHLTRDLRHHTPRFRFRYLTHPLRLYICAHLFTYSVYVALMEHDTYYYEDDHAGPEAPRHASQYQVLQPQFRQPSRPVSTRDRYRASQHGNTADDDVEDDAMQFDSFGTCQPLTG